MGVTKYRCLAVGAALVLPLPGAAQEIPEDGIKADEVSPVPMPPVRGPTPVDNPGTWISPSEYQRMVEYKLPEGTVRFRVRVNADGTAKSCKVITTSGSPKLDQFACRSVNFYGRWEPARDARGNAVEGFWYSAARFIN